MFIQFVFNHNVWQFVCICVMFFIVFSSLDVQTNAAQDNGSYDGQPVLSPQMDMIAFVSTRSGSPDIWIMSINGENAYNLTPDFADSMEAFPQWSPDGQKLLFDSAREGKTHVWVITIEDNSMTNLTEDIEQNTGGAVWSPDGSQIAFMISSGPNDGNIGVVNPDGKNLIRLSEGNNRYLFPQWSPDGQYISFISYEQVGANKLNLIKVSEPLEVQVLYEDVISYAWAPNGQAIALTNQKGDDFFVNQLWLLGLHNLSVSSLTEMGTFLAVSDLVWSLDSEKILFTSLCNSKSDIWMLVVASNEAANLTNCDRGLNAFPSWSTDGNWIIFQSDRNEGTSIWLMESNGSNLHNLIPNPKEGETSG